jgi:hypothetical protein
MKIFYCVNQEPALRNRCARIISTAWSFGSKWHQLVIEECLESGFPKPDEDDLNFLSDFTITHGEKLFA